MKPLALMGTSRILAGSALLFFLLVCRTTAIIPPSLGEENILLRAHRGAIFFQELCSYLDPEYRSHQKCSKYLQLWQTRFNRKFMSRRAVAAIAKVHDVDPRELYFVSRDMVKFIEMGFNQEVFNEALRRTPVAPMYDKTSDDYLEALVCEKSKPQMLYQVRCSEGGRMAMRYTIYGRRVRDFVFDSALGLETAWFKI